MRYVPFSSYRHKPVATPPNTPQGDSQPGPSFLATQMSSKTLKMHATNVGPHLGTIKTDFC